jgi:RNA polymerase sigma-70 factor (ECF subfamily)
LKDYQKILFPYAYAVLGSAEDARDAIQDVLSNYVATPRNHVENEKNYLIRGVINQSITLRNRRKKQVSEDDVWLPEPVATEAADTNLNLQEIVSYSLLVLLEQLNPKERAVFILKEGFGYSHEEIAEVLSDTVENSRKLLSRAKGKLDTVQVTKAASKTPEHEEFLNKYVHAIRDRDTRALEAMLADDITYYADGGKLRVLRKFCQGAHEVAEVLQVAYDRFLSATTIRFAEVNHEPALLYYYKGSLKMCAIFDIADGKIRRMNAVIDPEKLKNLTIA